MPSSKPPLQSLERLSREARVRTPALLGVNLSWTLLRLGLTAAVLSILVALATLVFHRGGWSEALTPLLRGIVEWIGLIGVILSSVGFFTPLLVVAGGRLRGGDPQAVMADRRREQAVKFARFLAGRLDRSAIDTARRAATAEINRFERRKFMHALLAAAGAAVASMARAMEAGTWVDLVVLVGAALAGGTTLGLLTMLDFVDRLNRILEALNEADAILTARKSQNTATDTASTAWSGLVALLDAGLRRLSGANGRT